MSNTNDPSETVYQITGKGSAYVAYLKAAGDSASYLDFEDEIFTPIERHVLEDIVASSVNEALPLVCADPHKPTAEELDKAALAIGYDMMRTYRELGRQEAESNDE